MKATICILFLAIVLAACGPAVLPTPTETAIPTAVPPTIMAIATQESAENKVGGECIPPVASWEFPLELPRSITHLPVIPPPSEWKVQTSLPEKDSDAYLELIEHHQDYDVVWVRLDKKYFRYRVDTEQWSTASFENESENDYLSWVFQDQYGKVWNLSTSGPYFRFFRLNDNAQFEPINSSGVRGEIIFNRSQLPLVDKDNTFWFLAYAMPNQMSLISFDPDTGEASAHLSGDYDAAFNPPYPFGQSIAIGQDGSIFLMRLKDAVLVRYDPSARAANDIVNLGNFDNKLGGSLGPDLFVDRGGNLWIEDYAWIDFRNLIIDGHPTLHQIIRSPLFITTGMNDLTTYQWVRPFPMLESSDGRIWFNGGAAGLVWLDPKNGKWCKFTTIYSNILEDKDGNLWLLYDSSLYKYTINPQ